MYGEWAAKGRKGGRKRDPRSHNNIVASHQVFPLLRCILLLLEKLLYYMYIVLTYTTTVLCVLCFKILEFEADAAPPEKYFVVSPRPADTNINGTICCDPRSGIDKYSRQTREKSSWKPPRVFHEDFSWVWSEYLRIRWAKLSILSLFHVFWSPPTTQYSISIPSDEYGQIFNTSPSTVAPKNVE